MFIVSQHLYLPVYVRPLAEAEIIGGEVGVGPRDASGIAEMGTAAGYAKGNGSHGRKVLFGSFKAAVRRPLG
jgi:hypothetical protein